MVKKHNSKSVLELSVLEQLDQGLKDLKKGRLIKC